MATVTANITANTSSTQTTSSLPGTVSPLTIQQTLSTNFQTSGTAADQVDLNYAATLSLAAAATTLDLKALTDRYGGAVNFARVRSVTIKNLSTTNGQIITVSPGSASGWSNWIVSTGGMILGASTANNVGGITVTNPSTTGWVVDSSHRNLTIDPGANTISAAIEINGASA